MKNKNKKDFYTLKEIVDMGLLPYKSVMTLRRLCRNGTIRAVRNPSPRSFIYVTHAEIERLRSLYSRNETT